MLSNKRALFGGRFQPFHNGHLYAIDSICAKNNYSQIVIGIANPDSLHVIDKVTEAYKNFLPERNPFTYEERFRMITESLKDRFGNSRIFHILPLFPPDLYGMELWENFIGNRDDIVYCIPSISEWEKTLIDRYLRMGLQVEEMAISRWQNISSTDIRERISRGEDTWKKYVPAAVSAIIEELIKKNPSRLRPS
jgi:nicotinamide-nucleotide adenylyltransferase